MLIVWWSSLFFLKMTISSLAQLSHSEALQVNNLFTQILETKGFNKNFTPIFDLIESFGHVVERDAIANQIRSFLSNR